MKTLDFPAGYVILSIRRIVHISLGGVIPMDYTQAVVDLCAGGAGAAAAMKPLMLHTVLFCPVVRWVCQELRACGV